MIEKEKKLLKGADLRVGVMGRVLGTQSVCGQSVIIRVLFLNHKCSTYNKQ